VAGDPCSRCFAHPGGGLRWHELRRRWEQQHTCCRIAGTSAAATPTPTSTSGGDDIATGGVKVTIADSSFSPSKIEVTSGTTVTWTNNDAVPHTVTSTRSDDVDSATSGLFDSGTLQAGESFSYTFTKAGDYPYECTIHASMPGMHAAGRVP
jgi:plastocyanin